MNTHPSRFRIGQRVLYAGHPATVKAITFTENKVLYDVHPDGPQYVRPLERVDSCDVEPLLIDPASLPDCSPPPPTSRHSV